MQQSVCRRAGYVIGSQYFIYFGVMGVVLPYFNLYCDHLGFSGVQIGFLSAARSIPLVVCPMLWGALADRLRIRKPIYLLCNIMSLAIWGLYLLTSDFRQMLIITICYSVFFSPIISFLEAFAMDVLGVAKKGYGRLRAWGSLSFIGVVLLLGPVIDATVIRIILPLVWVGAVAQAVGAFWLPVSPAAGSGSPMAGIHALFKGRIVLFLIAAFLMLVSHGAYYAFFSIHLKALGFGNAFIGLAWAVASLAEILVMLNSDRLFGRFSLEKILFFSFAAAVFRWFALPLARAPETVLALQLLHAATYGTFHMASILYMDVWIPPDLKTIGQAVNNALTYGLGLMVGFLVNGYLYQAAGPTAMYGISGLVALSGALVFGAMLRWTGDSRPAHPPIAE